jgi:hypothetical protein
MRPAGRGSKSGCNEIKDRSSARAIADYQESILPEECAPLRTQDVCLHVDRPAGFWMLTHFINSKALNFFN